jgi:hypothetical protein
MKVRGWRIAIVLLACACRSPQERDSDAPPVEVPAAAEPERAPEAVLTVEALRAIAPELTARSAAGLIEAFGRSGQPAEAVAEAGLATASQGFRTLDEDAVREVGALLDAAYATLAPEDRSRLGSYLDRVRSGGTTRDDSRAGHALFAQAATNLGAQRLLRLQALFERGILAGLQYEADARARTLAARTLEAEPPRASLVPGPHRVQVAPGAVRPPARSAPEVREPPKGRGEAYWRREAERRRARVATLERELAEAELIGASYVYGAASGDGQIGFGTPTPDPFYVNRTKINARIAQLRSQLDAAKQSLSDLDDDARRDYAMPAWLR